MRNLRSTDYSSTIMNIMRNHRSNNNNNNNNNSEVLLGANIHRPDAPVVQIIDPL